MNIVEIKNAFLEHIDLMAVCCKSNIRLFDFLPF